MIAGQFIAITLVNIGFLRIFLDLREQKNLETERNLAAAEAQAGLLTRHREELQLLLTEREEIIRQLTLSNKTAGMGALVASLAHELNQPLCAIRLNAQLVERKLNDPEVDVQGARKFLDSVIADNRRAANIITKLRNMFEHSNKEHGLIHLDELVRDTLALVEPRALHENVTIHSRLESELSLQGDSTQLQQVILNLLNNALDALMLIQTDHKTIGVRTENIGGRLVLHVTDNGVGIPEDLKPSVFELFKTNKAQGMGVGLWLSRTVINAHRGDIRFQSREGEGTHFEVELPVG
jgi:signal transduction histidine kinase